MQDIKITLTHLNIRQSIAILLTKLILAEVIITLTIITIFVVLVQSEQYFQFAIKNTIFFLTIVGVTGILKIGISIYVVLQWLNEYYEITTESVIHKKGILVKKTEKYNLDKVRALSVQNSFLGELCNFASITLYDIRMQKYLDLYLIHNPERYIKIIKTLRPDLEIKKRSIFIPFKSAESDDDLED